jgi:hypothetical protein
MHHGFDTVEYPGRDVMFAFKNDGPFDWVGFYLGGPQYAGKIYADGRSVTWSEGAYREIKALGYGVVPIFVGFQRGRFLSPSVGVSEVIQWGECHAKLASRWAKEISIPVNSAIFLDVEGGESLEKKFVDYILSFTKYLDSSTPYWGAIYCCRRPSEDLRRFGYNGALWLAQWKERAGICPSTGLRTSLPSPTCPVDDSCHVPDGFTLLQYGADLHVSYGGIMFFPVDLNVSRNPKPAGA